MLSGVPYVTIRPLFLLGHYPFGQKSVIGHAMKTAILLWSDLRMQVSSRKLRRNEGLEIYPPSSDPCSEQRMGLIFLVFRIVFITINRDPLSMNTTLTVMSFDVLMRSCGRCDLTLGRRRPTVRLRHAHRVFYVNTQE